MSSQTIIPEFWSFVERKALVRSVTLGLRHRVTYSARGFVSNWSKYSCIFWYPHILLKKKQKWGDPSDDTTKNHGLCITTGRAR